MDLSWGEFALLALGAFCVGFSKTGISGLGIIPVSLFAVVFQRQNQTLQSSGYLLPLLIIGDIFSVVLYRRHAQWSYLMKIFPWAAGGIVAAFFALKYVNAAAVGHLDQQKANDVLAKQLIGGLLTFLVAFQMIRWYLASRKPANKEEAPEPAHGMLYAAVMGISGGFATMIANAAGPIMALYLLAMRLPKMEFVGTAAWYFLILNVFKVPFSANLSFITADSLVVNLKLVPFVVIGALLGPLAIHRIPQKLFEWLALSLAGIFGLKLLFM